MNWVYRTLPAKLTSTLVTNTAHPPSSSTQATANNTASTEESDTTIAPNEKDYLRVADEAPEVPQKSRGLLQVPSRSSSNKIQPSPTSTGLSGATASDPRGSIGGRSKESKSSILGRRRNGSATSSKMSITPGGTPAGPTGNANAATSNAPVASQSSKKKGFLSFLCCGVPDSANTVNDLDVPAKKVSKVSAGQPTTASRPESNVVQQSSAQLPTEKDALKQAEPQMEDKKDLQSTTSGGPNGEISQPQRGSRDQPLPDLPKEAESSAASAGRANPSVIIQGPTRAESKRVISSQNSSKDQKDGEGDVRMEDPEPLPPADKEESAVPLPRKDETAAKTVLPPPPPGPAPSEDTAAPEAEQKQSWLLPPIAPRFQGKKCLVLDLDETLVHSSFKVRLSVHMRFSVANKLFRFYTKQISPFLLRLRGNTTMFT